MTVATTATTTPTAGWGESKSGRPTFVQHGQSIKPAPALKGHYVWWVSRGDNYVKWTYRPNSDLKADTAA